MSTHTVTFAGLATKFSVAAALLVLLTLGGAVVVATWSANEVAERSIRESLLLAGGLALLLALPIAFAMGRRIARPLTQLAKGAAEIREGNLDVKLPEAGDDEVGTLARAFRALVGELTEKAALEQMLAEMRRRARSRGRARGWFSRGAIRYSGRSARAAWERSTAPSTGSSTTKSP